jgi:hypothetical protein
VGKDYTGSSILNFQGFWFLRNFGIFIPGKNEGVESASFPTLAGDFRRHQHNAAGGLPTEGEVR